MGKIAYNCTVIFTKRPNLKLLQGLERHSETLDRAGDAFSQTLLKHKIAVYSFREERETRRYLIFNTVIRNNLYIVRFFSSRFTYLTLCQVVSEDSAKIGDGREEVGSIPADHSNMAKFAKSTDIGFKRVSAQLRRWVEEIRANDGAANPSRL